MDVIRGETFTQPISYVDLSDRRYEGCIFQHMVFEEVNLFSTIFDCCYFSNVIFRACAFYRTNFLRSNFAHRLVNFYGSGSLTKADIILPHYMRAPDAEFIAWKQVHFRMHPSADFSPMVGIIRCYVPQDAKRITPLWAEKVRVSKFTPTAYFDLHGFSLPADKVQYVDYAYPRLYNQNENSYIRYNLHEETQEINIDTNILQDCSYGYNVFLNINDAITF